MTPRQERINAAIQALEELYEYGGLLGASQPDKLLMMAVEEIRAWREALGVDPKDKPKATL
jgi:hypothetical protein